MWLAHAPALACCYIVAAHKCGQGRVRSRTRAGSLQRMFTGEVHLRCVPPEQAQRRAHHHFVAPGNQLLVQPQELELMAGRARDEGQQHLDRSGGVRRAGQHCRPSAGQQHGGRHDGLSSAHSEAVSCLTDWQSRMLPNTLVQIALRLVGNTERVQQARFMHFSFASSPPHLPVRQACHLHQRLHNHAFTACPSS